MSSTNPFDQQKPISGVKKIIAVSSGKGGVGKSTVATNLAVALGKKFSVGLLDADIYGPSIPRMVGAVNQKPEINSEQKIRPINRYNVKTMSMGYLVEEGAAVVWRGPMLFKAIDQFLRDIEWGELDFLIVDLPPGTGDVQLSLCQKVPVHGAVMVSTPQNISLIDVKKAVDMFERLQIKILGMVENMSYFLNPSTNEKIQMFPKGDLTQFAKQKNITLLAEVPMHPNVGLGGEAGVPVVESSPESAEAQAFFELARKVAELA